MKFGFQGQENENEISSIDGAYLAFKYRITDVRIGKFLSIDPLVAKYPYNSPYAFQENKMGMGRELEGLELTIFEQDLGAAYSKVETAESMNNAVTGGVLLHVGSIIDNITYFGSSTLSALFPIRFGLGFNWNNGFKFESNYFDNLTWGNSFRYFGGALDISLFINARLIRGFKSVNTELESSTTSSLLSKSKTFRSEEILYTKTKKTYPKSTVDLKTGKRLEGGEIYPKEKLGFSKEFDPFYSQPSPSDFDILNPAPNYNGISVFNRTMAGSFGAALGVFENTISNSPLFPLNNPISFDKDRSRGYICY